MKVKIFDESHEKDLETALNGFLANIEELQDIKYHVAIAMNGEEQIYCFTAMVIYK